MRVNAWALDTAKSKDDQNISVFCPVNEIYEPSNKREGRKKFVVIPFFVATNFTKLKIILFYQFSKNYRSFLAKKLSLSSQKYGVGIRDPRPGIQKKPIPDTGVKKAPDPQQR